MTLPINDFILNTKGFSKKNFRFQLIPWFGFAHHRFFNCFVRRFHTEFPFQTSVSSVKNIEDEELQEVCFHALLVGILLFEDGV